jgi:hypothetical protein
MMFENEITIAVANPPCAARIFGTNPLRAKPAEGYISEKYPVIVSNWIRCA